MRIAFRCQGKIRPPEHLSRPPWTGCRVRRIGPLGSFRPPRPFTRHTSRQLMRMLGSSDERWRKYLFY